MTPAITRSTCIVDVPKKHGDKDHLNLGRYEDALVKLILGADTPLTVALQGEWGSGKTSLMNTLRHQLADDPSGHARFFGIWVNTWEYSLMRQPEEAILRILASAIAQIVACDASNKQRGQAVLSSLGKVARGAWFLTKIGVNVVAKSATGIDNLTGVGQTQPDVPAAEDEPESEISRMKREIGEMVAACVGKPDSPRKGFVFFIDDLDRIDPTVAVQILELLKNIFDIKHCIFVLAIDYDVVIKGLKPKFGDYTAANEREFRSFFDKIIQLPFSMPVSKYRIDDFLMNSLHNIGFLTPEELGDKELKETFSKLALHSVGTNPRSLKRLVNILSLLQLLGFEDTETSPVQKRVDFALVCIQISYPAIYNQLAASPEFLKWDDNLLRKAGVPPLSADAKDQLLKSREFDEPWEQALYALCQPDPYLKSRVADISAILNAVRDSLSAHDNLDDVMRHALQISSVTNVTAQPHEDGSRAVPFHQSSELKKLHEKLLPILNTLLVGEGFKKAAQINSRVQSWLKYQSPGGPGTWYVNQLSVWPGPKGYVVALQGGDWLLHGHTRSWIIDEDLAHLKVAKEDFDRVRDRFEHLAEGSQLPQPEITFNFRFRSKAEGSPCYELGVQYHFPVPSLEEVFSDRFVSALAGTMLEFFKAKRDMYQLLAGPAKTDTP